VVVCLAGGGCATTYFDLEVEGRGGYSMARHFAERGAVVISFDHLGIGASDSVDDLASITPTLLARVHDHAVLETLARLRDDDGTGEVGRVPVSVTVGLGHSMGAMVLGVQQARHRTFDALVALGHGHHGLPEVLGDDERSVSGPNVAAIEVAVQRLARARFASDSGVARRPPATGTFFTDDVPAEVREAFDRAAVPLLPTCGLMSMIPSSIHAEQAAVKVPLFLGFGDEDLIDDHVDALSGWSSASDRTLFVLAGSGHCHNQARTRNVLWDRILAWIEALSAPARSN
jgi:alpha-beta hydrolase superfamily lysophospholipase